MSLRRTKPSLIELSRVPKHGLPTAGVMSVRFHLQMFGIPHEETKTPLCIVYPYKILPAPKGSEDAAIEVAFDASAECAHKDAWLSAALSSRGMVSSFKVDVVFGTSLAEVDAPTDATAVFSIPDFVDMKPNPLFANLVNDLNQRLRDTQSQDIPDALVESADGRRLSARRGCQVRNPFRVELVEPRRRLAMELFIELPIVFTDCYEGRLDVPGVGSYLFNDDIVACIDGPMDRRRVCNLVPPYVTSGKIAQIDALVHARKLAAASARA